MKQLGQPAKGRTPTKEELRSLVESRDLDSLMEVMNDSGRVPTLRLAHKLATDLLNDEPETLYQWGIAMAECQEWGTRSAAGWFIGAQYELDPDDAADRLIDLVDDDNWSVREGAAFGLARVLGDHFDEVMPLFRRWSQHDSVNVRRGVVISVMPVIRDPLNGLQRARPCLDLLEPLLSDREPYIRKNLGPFAIGTALLRHHPDITFQALEEWRDRYTDTNVRWNLAKAVSTSGGRRNLSRSISFLETLADDQRPEVQRVVSSAMRSLTK